MTTHAAAHGGTPKIKDTRWRIDPVQSQIEFHTGTLMGLSTVIGRFSRYDGTLDLTRQPAIELTVEAGSVDTKNTRRDTHLRSADFFDVDEHPIIRFVSESAALDGDRLTAHGYLHALGRSLPLDLEVTVRRIYDELELEATTPIDHRELGMTWGKCIVRTPSRLIVKARLFQDAA
jgi:polyisoprenoid-binding protein YceI